MTPYHRAATLASSVAGAVIVALDGTVLTVAQPTLQRDLAASAAQVQWTSTGYLVAVAALLVFAGRLGDRYGHRPLFAAGMLGFGAASAGIAVAPGIGWVIGLRVAQGVCGALLQPATLGMVRTAFPPDRLAPAIALRTGAIGLAAAAGPLVGGALVTGLGWRSVFYVNVLPAALFGVLALATRGTERPGLSPAAGLDEPGVRAATSPGRPEASPAGPGDPAVRLDVPGALLLAVALGCAVQTLAALPEPGWTGPLVAVVAGTAFVRHERRTPSPLLPPDVIGSAAVGSALAVLVAASSALFGALFVGTYLLQGTLGLDPFHSALLSLPLAVLMVLAAPVCPLLLRRVGARRTTVGAMGLLALGILVLARASGALALGGGFALLGAGFGTVMVAATQVVVRESPVERAGVAGGLQQTAMNVGPALGVAAATTLRGLDRGDALPLMVLAGVAVTGAVLGRALPKRSGSVITDRPEPGDRLRVPARR
ncbi:MFS transporter [Streptomyces sp. NPDC014864]|uniref:MFS transporter n=1 Tax=Streptomyces sp. NPDC014864 TaxID=3364924 RepID=UPI003702403C